MTLFDLVGNSAKNLEKTLEKSKEVYRTWVRTFDKGTHTWRMTTKNISITTEAYEALSREKRKNESFTDAILRLTHRTGKLVDCLGGWEMSNGESERISKELELGWQQTNKRRTTSL